MRVRTPIAVLDDARPGQERLTVLTGFLGAITAENSAQISDALAALNAANASGETLAGYFSYELGYGLEGKLAGRMPEPRAAPLLWFGRFAQAQHLTGTDIDAWFTANIVGRAYAGPLHVAWTREIGRAHV